MFKTRRKRFERLLALRKRELDEKQGDLSRALNAQRQTRELLEIAQGKLQEAAARYRGAPGEQRTADNYLEAGNWLQQQVGEVEKALAVHEQAGERVRLTTIAVQNAEKAKRQIETLIERLDKEQALVEGRREQNDQDELAARLVRAATASK